MKEMWAATVAPAIQRTARRRRKVIAHYRIKCFGVGESDLEAMLPDLIARERYPLVGITVHQATITLRITAEGETPAAARAAMQPTIDTIHQCLGDLIFGEEDDELEDVVVRLLQERRQDACGRRVGHRRPAQPLAQRLRCSRTSLERPRVPRAGLALLKSFGRLEHSRSPAEDRLSSWRREGLKHPGTDFGLAVGPHGIADSRHDARPPFILALAHSGGSHPPRDPLRRPSGDPRPAPAKQALNLLRLHLLGKA